MSDDANVQPVDKVMPEVTGFGKLSYRVSDAPPPINYHDWYVMAVLVELRLIRKALDKLSDVNPPVETSKPTVEVPKAKK